MAARASLEDIGSRVSVLMSAPPRISLPSFLPPLSWRHSRRFVSADREGYASSTAAKLSVDPPSQRRRCSWSRWPGAHLALRRTYDAAMGPLVRIVGAMG